MMIKRCKVRKSEKDAWYAVGLHPTYFDTLMSPSCISSPLLQQVPSSKPSNRSRIIDIDQEILKNVMWDGRQLTAPGILPERICQNTVAQTSSHSSHSGGDRSYTQLLSVTEPRCFLRRSFGPSSSTFVAIHGWKEYQCAHLMAAHWHDQSMLPRTPRHAETLTSHYEDSMKTREG